MICSQRIHHDNPWGDSTLSRKADVGLSTVRRLWHDPYRHVEISVLERIARVLGVATGDLLKDVPDEETD